MKQDEALSSRENVPEVRMEFHKKHNSQFSKNWRLKELMIMLILLLLQVDMVMARDNLGQGQVEQCLKSLGWRLINAEHDLDRRKITGAVMLKNNPDGNHD